MNPLIQAGTSIVIFALIAYSFAIITEQRTHMLSKKVLVFLTLGVMLDIIATTFMILGSSTGGIHFTWLYWVFFAAGDVNRCHFNVAPKGQTRIRSTGTSVLASVF